MPVKDKIDVNEDRDANQLTIEIDTTGTGRAIADGLISHIHGMLAEDLDKAEAES